MAANEALFVLVPEYADWEPSLLSAALRRGFGMWEPRFRPRVVAPGMEPVPSIGGFRTQPDYSFDSAPDDFAALILIGGTNWFGDEAKRVLPLVRKAVQKGAVLGGICAAAAFLGSNGFLNDVEHTGNCLEEMTSPAGSLYTGKDKYRADSQSVRDGKTVTANGAGFIEFTRNVLAALDAVPADTLARFYTICKTGFFSA